MYSYRKYVLTQEVCTHTGSMYLYRKYIILTQEVCTHTGSMYLHRNYVPTQKVRMYSQWTCMITIYSLVVGVMGVGVFLEARGCNTLEVEGTGLDTGET